jgi:Cytochrome P460
MKRISVRLFVAAACIGASTPFAAPALDDTASPLLGVKIPPGYRDWPVISVAHEAGNNNDLRAVLGNAMAIKAFREGKLPYPDGTIIARVAWSYVPSEENNKVFGRAQSFVAGARQSTFNCRSRTQENTPRRAGGVSLNLKTANLPTRGCTKPALPATRLPRFAISYSPIIHSHPDTRRES